MAAYQWHDRLGRGAETYMTRLRLLWCSGEVDGCCSGVNGLFLDGGIRGW